MTTYSPKNLPATTTLAYSAEGPHVHYQYIDIDFAVRNVTTADALNVMRIPAKSLVLYANYMTLSTVADATGTFVIGDSVNSYVASAVAVAAGANGVAAITVPKIYMTANTLQLKTVATASLTSGVIRVFMLIADLNSATQAANAVVSWA